MGDMHEDDPSVVWELAKKVGISMFVTRDGDNLEGRPLQAYPDREAGTIIYMTDSPHVLGQVAADPRVLLSFADKGSNNFAAIDGRAAISNDRAKIKELWTVWAEAFWDGPDDPAIRIVSVTPGPRALLGCAERCSHDLGDGRGRCDGQPAETWQGWRRRAVVGFTRIEKMARVTGLEPATFGVTGRRSNRLSYTPRSRPFEGRARARGLGHGRREGQDRRRCSIRAAAIAWRWRSRRRSRRRF